MTKQQLNAFWVRQVESIFRTGLLQSDLFLWREYWSDIPIAAKLIIKENMPSFGNEAI